ncbi:hypothetical protein D0T84_18015 [Dysgonomonas sp. 521]|uniref:6-carboxytetrahydropterin synthase n=1 Tax=Dysgonomonas sp. 521 TaxID=2302932 RepID=UPI0013D09963|nr:6-carboxytetrahydropterin synthase [Dysgonomonas sp. 521]NDV96788.1 hypothetical protein [Dysgonomonas sp. 521]
MIIARKFEISIAYYSKEKNSLSGLNLNVIVGFEGSIDVKTGMIIDVSLIKKIVSSKLDLFDHTCISNNSFTKYEFFKHLTDAFWNIISSIEFDGVALKCISISEMFGHKIKKKANEQSFFIETYLLSDNIIPISRIMDLDNYFVNPIRFEIASKNEPVINDYINQYNPNKIDSFSTICTLSDQILKNNLSVKWLLLNGLFEIYFKDKFIFITMYHFFDFSHRLNNPNLSYRENIDLFGKCNEQHGHRYRIGVTLQTTRNTFIKDKELLKILIQSLPNTLLNIGDMITTGENILLYFKDQIKKATHKSTFDISLQETPNNYFFLEVKDDIKAYIKD